MPETKADVTSLQQFKAGTLLVKEGELSRKMYIIQEGRARVYKTYMGQKITLDILGPGEIFGELSFFDAEPRSASVESLVDLSVTVVDAESLQQGKATQLPDWLKPVFKTIFRRFRQADQKITILQNMKEFQKRFFKDKDYAKTIYLEASRMLKALENYYARNSEKGAVRSDLLYQQLDEAMDDRQIALSVFWRKLKEFDLIDHHKAEAEGVVVLNQPAVEGFHKFLDEECTSARYLLPSRAAIEVIGKICGIQKGNANVFAFEDLKIQSEGKDAGALSELKQAGLLMLTKKTLAVQVENLHPYQVYLNILKALDANEG